MATGQNTAKFKLNFGRSVHYIAQSHLLNSLLTCRLRAGIGADNLGYSMKVQKEGENNLTNATISYLVTICHHCDHL